MDDGDVAGAVAILEVAKQDAPDDPRIFRGLAIGLLRLGRTAEARKAYERLIELRPGAPRDDDLRARFENDR
jgi:Flp pilus assembly protein TadD